MTRREVVEWKVLGWIAALGAVLLWTVGAHTLAVVVLVIGVVLQPAGGDEQQAVQVIDLDPERDLIVLTSNRPITSEQAEMVRATWRKVCMPDGGVSVAVLPEFDVTVVRGARVPLRVAE